MLYVNFKAYNSYVTDSLYQWDINQKLNIIGLDLTTAPEVHFANANMERAIVRQGTINKGTITVDIPNSILQEPLPIKAYIGIYEDKTFKIIETVKIPVVPKERPTDYKFVDDGGDVYSYNEILNKMMTFESKYLTGYTTWVDDVSDLKTRVTFVEGELKTALENDAKIVSGSYDGDNNYGNGHTITLTFPFKPKMVFVTCSTHDAEKHEAWVYGQTEANLGTITNITWTENSVTWDVTNTGDHLNSGSKTYLWVAVG